MRRMIGFLAAAVGAVAIAAPPPPAEAAQGPNPREVKDIRPGSVRSKPRRMVEYRGDVYFDANDGAHGTELWRTDGTARGTELAADIVPGAESSSPIGPIVTRRRPALLLRRAQQRRGACSRAMARRRARRRSPGPRAPTRSPSCPRRAASTSGFPIEDGPYSGASVGAVDRGRHAGRNARDPRPPLQRVPGLPRAGRVGRQQRHRRRPAGVLLLLRRRTWRRAVAHRRHGRGHGRWSPTSSRAPGSSQSGSFTRLGDEVVFFVRRDGRAELWRSDGTEAGTGLVSAIPADQRVGRPLVSGGRVVLLRHDQRQHADLEQRRHAVRDDGGRRASVLRRLRRGGAGPGGDGPVLRV